MRCCCSAIQKRCLSANRTSWVDKYARIEQALRVECSLRRAQRLGEQRWALPVVPRAMIATDRVVMRDRPTICNHGTESRALDCEPFPADLPRLPHPAHPEIA